MKKRVLPVLIILALIALSLGVFYLEKQSSGNDRQKHQEVKGLVTETDDSNLVRSGIARIGYQLLRVRILKGKYKGEEIDVSNNLVGTFEIDSYFKPGDKIIIAILEKDGEIKDAKAVDLYRQGWEMLLFGIFIALLLVFAGLTGLRALFSFIASLLVIWKILIPGLLDGRQPLILTCAVLVALTAIIIFSVAGFTRKGLSAFCGTLSGLFIAIALTCLFGSKLGLLGLTQPYSQTLLFSGHLGLDMRFIFYAAVVIGASGAAMDIAMDVAASMQEVKLKRPSISTGELIQSGFNVGRAVIGTMTTTLLLAYSGGYLTLLMLFMTKDSSLIRILNLKIVSTEIMRILIGSIGLVLVAPMTALFAGWLLSERKPAMKAGESFPD